MKTHKDTDTHEDVYRSKRDHIKMYTIPTRKLFQDDLEIHCGNCYERLPCHKNKSESLFCLLSLQDTSTETLRKWMGKKLQGGCTVLNLQKYHSGRTT